MKINLKINKLIYFSRLPQTFVYGNLVRNAKQFLMSSSKIYTPVVRNSDKKHVNPKFLKINVGER